MRLLVQRVRACGVRVDGADVARIGQGVLVLAGFGAADGPDAPGAAWWRAMVEKLCVLRVFPDQSGRMNLGLEESGGQVLVVSQFTLYADCRRGRRPSFTGAAAPEVALALYERLCADVAQRLPGRVSRGVFGADMDVDLVNWGPVTVMLDSADFC